MKKGLKILVFILCVSMLTLMTGCEKEEKIESKEMDSFEISQPIVGTMTFSYPKSLAFSVTSEEETGREGAPDLEKRIIYDIYSPDYISNLIMIPSFGPEEYYVKDKEERKKDPGYKEYKWGGYEAYSYGTNDNFGFNILLYTDKIGFIYYIEGQAYTNDNKRGIIQIFNEKGIQDLLNSLVYKKTESEQ